MGNVQEKLEKSVEACDANGVHAAIEDGADPSKGFKLLQKSVERGSLSVARELLASNKFTDGDVIESISMINPEQFPETAPEILSLLLSSSPSGLEVTSFASQGYQNLTALLFAVAQNSEAKVKLFLEHGASPTAVINVAEVRYSHSVIAVAMNQRKEVTELKLSALSMAFQHKFRDRRPSIGMLKMLMADGLGQEQVDEAMNLMLSHTTTVPIDQDTVNLFIAHGANLTPTGFFQAVRNGHAAAVDAMIRTGKFKANSQKDEPFHKEAALDEAIRHRHINATLDDVRAVCKVLLQHGADPNTYSADQWDFSGKPLGPSAVPVLFSALATGDSQLVSLLLECGSNVNLASLRGDNGSGGVGVLHYYFSTVFHTRLNVDVLRLLLHHGADVNLLDGQLKTPLHILVLRNSSSDSCATAGGTSRLTAAGHCAHELLQRGARIDAALLEHVKSLPGSFGWHDVFSKFT